MVKKELIIIAGANGSGKTTFALPYVSERGYDFLNADEIAKKLDEQGESNTMVKAGRIFFKRLEANLKGNISFVVETTLSGSYINKVAKRAKAKGYRVIMVYIFLNDAHLCVERVKSRVLKGGHDVPVEAIIRRYYRSKNNFWNNFRELSDEWSMFYNGIDGFQQVAIALDKDYFVFNEILFNKFKRDVI